MPSGGVAAPTSHAAVLMRFGVREHVEGGGRVGHHVVVHLPVVPGGKKAIPSQGDSADLDDGQMRAQQSKSIFGLDAEPEGKP